jgi:hypothetical protein
VTFIEADHPRARGLFVDKPQSAPEATLGAPVWQEERTEYPSGALESITSKDAAGDVRQFQNFADGLDDAGEPQLIREQNFTGRVLHDPDENTPSARQWKDGNLSLVLHSRHGEIQDPKSGEAALRSFRADGTVELLQHYSAGKLQDPAPGKPAQVTMLPNGMSREIYYTAGVGTKQVDRMPVSDLLGLNVPGVIVSTLTAA